MRDGGGLMGNVADAELLRSGGIVEKGHSISSALGIQQGRSGGSGYLSQLGD